MNCGFAVDRIWHDYGLDLALYTFDRNGYLESGVAWIQVKASDKPNRTQDGNFVRVRLQRRDVLAWLADAYPVILVVYDGRTDRTYWLSIQRCFAGAQAFTKLTGTTTTMTVAVPTTNVLNARAMRGFALEKAAVLARRNEPI